MIFQIRAQAIAVLALACAAAFPLVAQSKPKKAVPNPQGSAVQFSCTFPSSPTDCGFMEQAKAMPRATIVGGGRDGSTAVRLHTRAGDSDVSGSGTWERNDLALSQQATDCHEGREQWWAHSVLFPEDYVTPPSGGGGTVMTFHDTTNSGIANFHVDAMPEPMGLRLRGYGGSGPGAGRYEVSLGPVTRNAWYDFVYQVKWSSGPDGYLNAWVNGVQRLAHRGPTLYSGQGCYLKLMNFHSPFGQASSVIHDRVIRGTSREAVWPGASAPAPAPSAGTPFTGTPIALPGTFEAENFDRGGQGLGYRDFTSGNSGYQYRTTEDVDIILSNDAAGGGYVVNNFQSGEWLAYTVKVASSGKYDVAIRASNNYSKSVAFQIEVNGVNVTGPVTVPMTGAWSSYQWIGKQGVDLTAGTHVLKVVAVNQYFNLNQVRVLAAAPASGSDAAGPLPVEGELNFYVEADSTARREAQRLRDLGRWSDAALIDKIAVNSQARWFGNWNANVQSDVNGYVGAAFAAKAVPVLVAYNIPQRDCGQYSAGGASSADAYRSWIRSFADGIAGRKSIVVLEPDAVALNTCLSEADKRLRNDLLREAIVTLKGKGALVYLDAGNAGWVPVADMASRLTSAGIAQSDGFALNVSNFHPTETTAAYGEKISALVGGKRFVIDTSRNGRGSNGEWCNPSGRGLGARATNLTGRPLVDAYLWVKRPGESDGTCNGGPAAGSWWLDYALGLARNAAF